MEEFQVIWSLRAVDELESIRQFVAADRPNTAEAVVDAILGRIEQLKRFPFAGAKFRRRSKGQYREIGWRRFRVFYRVDRRMKSIFVASIWHGARRNPRGLD